MSLIIGRLNLTPDISHRKNWKWQGGKQFTSQNISGARGISSLQGVNIPQINIAFPLSDTTLTKTEILDQQVQEMINNPHILESYLQWSENPSKNGFYRLISGNIAINSLFDTGDFMFQGTLEEVGKDSLYQRALQCNRELRDTDYTGITQQSLHGIPVPSTMTFSDALRRSRTGSATQGVVLRNLSNQTIIPYNMTDSYINQFDVVCYDTMGSASESDWVEVLGPDHKFTGDAVIDNTLIRIKTQITDGTNPGYINMQYYASAQWNDGGSFHYRDNTNSVAWKSYAPRLSLKKVSPEEIILVLTWYHASYQDPIPQAELTLQRGKYDVVAKINFLSGSAPAGFQVRATSFGSNRDFAFADSIIEPEVSYDESPTATTANYIGILENSMDYILGICLTYQDAVNVIETSSKVSTIIGEITDKIHSIFCCPIDASQLFKQEAEDINVGASSDVPDSNCSNDYRVEYLSNTGWVTVLDSSALNLDSGAYRVFLAARSSGSITPEFRGVTPSTTGGSVSNTYLSTWQILNLGDFTISSTSDDIKVDVKDASSGLVYLDAVWLIPKTTDNWAGPYNFGARLLYKSTVIPKVIRR